MRIGINMLLWTTHVGREHLPLFATIVPDLRTGLARFVEVF